MDRFSAEHIDRELGNWLRDESLMRAPAGLVEDVFARTSRTRQARRWWPPASPLRARRPAPHLVGADRATPWSRGSLLAGGAAIVLALIVVGLSLRPGGGPGTIGGPSASASPQRTPSAAASPVVTPSPAASADGTPRAAPTPAPTTVGDLVALRLDLGANAAPISVIAAFGSIWVADIHANDVRRFQPDTMREIARIPVPGAAWLAVAADALWVTSQNGTGLSRIDPATNTVVAHVGDVPPCGAPVVAFGDLWQAACDADVVLRIDPVTNALIDTIPAQRHLFLVLAGGRLISAGPEGLASLDPTTGRFTTIGNRAAVGPGFLASDGTTVWAFNSAGVTRIDPADGRTLAQFSYPGGQALAFAAGHAWLTVQSIGVVEIDLATNAITRTIPLLPSPLVPLESGGVLWVTDFDTNALWRITL